VSAASFDGGQCFGEFSGGNARERANFGRRSEVVSRGPDYNNFYIARLVANAAQLVIVKLYESFCEILASG